VDLFSPAPDPTMDLSQVEPRRLVHVGALTPVKDQATLLRAFAGLRRSGVCATLDIVGDGPLRSELQLRARELGLNGSVRFLGEVDHAELPSVYRAADVLVVASRHEAQCMVGVEAAACGTPVAGTRVGVIPQLTRAIADVADADGLGAAIGTQLADPAKPTAPLQVRATYALDVCSGRFRDLYVNLIAA
jgi:glycosyltransferase involved in cell wall biosynthesis